MVGDEQLHKSTVIDPVCHMTVDPKSSAGSFEFEGRTYHFCSKHCLKKFSENPRQFLQPTPSQPITLQRVPKDALTFTCPMHPEVTKTGPGSCPKCGMALEASEIQKPHQKVEYTCPMHPEIVRDAPGNCPICGMTLEPRIVTGEEENAELKDMKRRFWTSTALTLPLLFLAMSEFIPGDPVRMGLGPR